MANGSIVANGWIVASLSMAEPRRRWLRPRGADDLGLRRALADRALPLLVAAMTFLAALSAAGFVAASAIARHWQEGAAAALTVLVPRPGEPAGEPGRTRRDAALSVLSGSAALAEVRALADAELADLLRPWLGPEAERLSLPLPAVIAVRLAPGAGEHGAELDALAARLEAVAPGTLLERQDVWARRLAVLARSLQACAGAVLLLVGAVAAALVAVATRAGLAARREAIEIVHLLGATDAYIAAGFARRVTWLAGLGGTAGAVAALPVLLALGLLALPFLRRDIGAAADPALLAAAVPPLLWLVLPALAATAAAIGWLTAQATVRAWLRGLP